MKFETILDATIAASIATTPYWYGNLDDEKAQKHNHRKGRQCDAFRARLERMYKLKGATSLERAMGRACDELGLDYIFIDEIVSDPLPRG